jgi:hypothetical protein
VSFLQKLNLNVINMWRRKGEVMRKICVSLIPVMLVLGLSISAHAVLIDLGGGMIYSTDLDLTWLQDADYARTSGYDADGLMTWDEANTWATNLVYGGLSGWRLPTVDPDNPNAQNGATLLHEMGYLRYYECARNMNNCPFINVSTEVDGNIHDEYWSGTTCTTGDNKIGAWNFYFSCA